VKNVKSLMLGMLAETNIHTGAGGSGGLIDLPVAREAASDYPFVPGSSLKGALHQWATDVDHKTLFGTTESAGGLLISDARLLLLPVRSMDSAYRWVTCPHLLERAARDAGRCGIRGALELSTVLDRGQCVGSTVDGISLLLEERQFMVVEPLADALAGWLREFVPQTGPHASTCARLQDQAVVLHDDDFVWFARNALAVAARNVLDKTTKKSTNLWYEESLPPDTLLYTMIFERCDGSLAPLRRLVVEQPYLQIGGNETVGMGWFALQAVGGHT
jgi:CRISPR-associated protein Cmr4